MTSRQPESPSSPHLPVQRFERGARRFRAGCVSVPLVSRLLAGGVLVLAALGVFVCCGELYKQGVNGPRAHGERPDGSAGRFSIYQMDVAPGTQTVLLSGCGWRMCCIDLYTGEAVELDEIWRDDVWAVAQSSDGSVIAVGYSDGSVALRSATPPGSGVRVQRFHSGVARCLDVSHDGRFVLSGSTDGSVRLWRHDADRPVSLADEGPNEVTRVRLSPDGTTAVAGFADGRVTCWRVEDGRVLETQRVHTSKITALAFAADGRRLVTTALDGYVRVWDLHNGRMHALSFRATGGHGVRHPISAAISPDGETLAIGGYGYLWLLEGHSLATLAELAGHQSAVTSLQFSPEGHYLFSASHDGTLRVWDVEHRADVHCLFPRPR